MHIRTVAREKSNATALFSVWHFCETVCGLFLDTMDNWDEKKLEEVVNKKHGEAEKKKPKTQIVCLSFICFY